MIIKLPSFLPPRTCVFCGGGPLTDEHIWAEWIQKFAPHPLRKKYEHITISGRTNTIKSVRSWNGDTLNGTIPCVCARCNNGWMSTLQKRAKPFLVPLIQGQWPTLDEWPVRSIAAWITMFSMVYEFRDPGTVAIPFEQRDEFRRSRDAPKDWRIWIAKVDPNRWRGTTFHIGMGLYDQATVPSFKTPANTQITTAVIGHLLIHSFYISPTLAHFQLNPAYATTLGLFPIWPPQNTLPHCPVRVLTDRDADNIATTIRKNEAFT
jgi:hypothetical protein